ncbi:DUF397 domain-containing protein [Streptomyces parvulus]|uniref:DUF397 domain-containing protein n=1 Tax=Streptomyces parvulus TaxID=146923 RepID=UPI001E49B944|nr:DUF397 domain-containing protein [Streptomyces parvulus]MCC9155745.1 DUF397 domain-containing protein [Streptomyces parvulus]MCE7687975.1 DUF397 domain-containing protein [Streptomyces parvulus]
MRRSTTETPRWRKSSFSGGGDGNTCVEVAPLRSRVAIRDSKNPNHGTLTVPIGAFAALVRSLKTTAN